MENRRNIEWYIPWHVLQFTHEFDKMDIKQIGSNINQTLTEYICTHIVSGLLVSSGSRFGSNFDWNLSQLYYQQSHISQFHWPHFRLNMKHTLKIQEQKSSFRQFVVTCKDFFSFNGSWILQKTFPTLNRKYFTKYNSFTCWSSKFNCSNAQLLVSYSDNRWRGI